ncbi:MAG: TraB/GumN family protein [Spirochaetaceae bacterium]|jgi:uncharacterized protein YbaP (TraB family)|nr:TraB/GumN family protein [Spirochaetaceae bacterium]
MRKICCVIIGVVFVNCVLYADEFLGEIQKESSVWQITKNGNTVYLGGSVHVLPKNTTIPPAFSRAFDLSDIIVFEADDVTKYMQDNDFAQSLQMKMLLPEGLTLKNVITQESYDALSAACKRFGFSIKMFEKMRPSALLNALFVVQIQKYGFTETGVDEYFSKLAEKENKEKAFLETVDFQIDLLVNMFDNNIDEYISYSALELAKSKSEFTKELDLLLDDWKNGTNEYIGESNYELKITYPDVYDRLIKDRNNSWLPVIEQYLGSAETEFVIVGLAHIHGEDGLLTQLTEGGYSIIQIK